MGWCETDALEDLPARSYFWLSLIPPSTQVRANVTLDIFAESGSVSIMPDNLKIEVNSSD